MSGLNSPVTGSSFIPDSKCSSYVEPVFFFQQIAEEITESFHLVKWNIPYRVDRFPRMECSIIFSGLPGLFSLSTVDLHSGIAQDEHSTRNFSDITLASLFHPLGFAHTGIGNSSGFPTIWLPGRVVSCDCWSYL